MTGHYDVIVMGLGGVGSAAAAHLARRGLRVLGLDQFAAAHHHGSSHGQTRAIRQAYFEDPAYVPLLRRAYALWHELEAEVSQRLFAHVGLLEVGPPDGSLIRGVLRSAREHAIEVELLNAEDCAARFPQFLCPAKYAAVWEPRAGYLRVEECVRAHLHAAQRHGAELRFHSAVQQWEDQQSHLRVRTATDTFEAGQLIVTAGPWATHWLSPLALQVLRKQVYWFPACHPAFAAGCPVYLFELPHGLFYGFPAVDADGIKVGEHTGGVAVSEPSVDAEQGDDPQDAGRIGDFVSAHLPGVQPRGGRRSTCWYTMSTDGHFRIGRHADCPRIIYVAGLSGHGFKFAPVLGEILADLAVDGTTRHPIELFQ